MGLYSVCNIDSAWSVNTHTLAPPKSPRLHPPSKNPPAPKPIQLIEMHRNGKRKKTHNSNRRFSRRADIASDTQQSGKAGVRSVEPNVMYVIMVTVCCILIMQIILGVLAMHYINGMQAILLQCMMRA